jgi:hypothetical protein
VVPFHTNKSNPQQRHQYQQQQQQQQQKRVQTIQLRNPKNDECEIFVSNIATNKHENRQVFILQHFQLRKSNVKESI